MKRLTDMEFPRGLATELINDAATAFPIRFFVVDNSGSMQTADGNRLVRSRGTWTSVKATRWQELSDTVSLVASISEAIGARTDFHLLNAVRGRQHVTVGGPGTLPCAPGAALDAASFEQFLQQVSPSGGTPLTESVVRITETVRPLAEAMRACGQQAVVIIASDGVPNHPQSFVQALRELQALPVWVVVRLCTDDDSIVSYWNDLDGSLEAPLEVLDDERGEAIEIREKNPWLTYGRPLHLARTFGLRNKLFDLLDEAALVPSQIKSFCEVFLGCGRLPEPEIDWKAFRTAVSEALDAEATVYEPISARARPWILTSRLGALPLVQAFVACAEPCIIS